MDETAGAHALATGDILLLAIQKPNGVTYKYDDTNPDARTARLVADRAIQAAAGQREAVHVENQLVHETGARYIDFVVPGLLGMNLMGSAIWGLGFSIVEARQKKLLKRLVASPMPRWQYLTSFLLSRLALLVIEVVVFLGFCAAGFWRAVSRFDVAVGFPVRAHLSLVFRAGAAGGFARQDNGRRFRADESRHAPHVDSVRRVLFGVPFPRNHSAPGPDAAADRGNRCPAGKYAARNDSGAVGRSCRNNARLDGGILCCRAAHLPLEIAAARFGHECT